MLSSDVTLDRRCLQYSRTSNSSGYKVTHVSCLSWWCWRTAQFERVFCAP
jgi:hypothetical protein